MIGAILKIRICQSRRILNDLGLGRVIFVFFMLAGLAYQLFIATKDSLQIAIPVWLLIILLLHFKRKDLLFLKSHVTGYKQVMMIEYLFISLPLLSGLIYYNHFLWLIGYPVALVLILQIARQPKKFTLNTFIQKWIPDQDFEWKSGVRNSLFYLIPIWITGIAGSFWPGTVPVVMMVLGLFLIGFTQKNEPLQMLIVFEKSAGRLLLHKIKQQLSLMTIIMLPLMIIYFIFHPQYWYITAMFYLILVICLTYAVLCKYAFYRPDLSTGNQVFVALGPASILVSFLLPLVLVL